MSRPKNYWYDFSKKMIMRYSLLNDDVPIESAYKKAIDETIVEVKQHKDGKAHMKAIELVLLKKSHNEIGAAMKLHYSERSIQIWINDFVNNVGRRAGFESECRTGKEEKHK